MGKHKTTTKICSNCNSVFQARNSDLKTGGGLFCSRVCKNKGKNNPNFRNGGLTNYQYKLRAKRKNPLRFIAMQEVQKAIRNRTLTRKECEVCGIFPSEAHHEDYNKPLVVKWLCRKHHVEIHHK